MAFCGYETPTGTYRNLGPLLESLLHFGKEKVPAQVCTEWLDAESMKKLATELRAACEACDLPALDSLVEKMEQLPLPKDLLEQVTIAVENIDFDAIQELAHTMDADA